MCGRAGIIISVFLAVALGETLAFAQSSPWDKPNPNSGSASPSAHPWARVMGNWDMTFTGKDGGLLGNGHFAFHDVPGTYTDSASGMFPKPANGNWELPCERGRIDGANVELGCWGFGLLKLRLSPDGNTLRGTWTNRNDGVPEGQVAFTRPRPATIERLEVLPESESRLDYTKMREEWARGHQPQIRLRLQGRDLPIWIHVRARPQRDYAIDDPDYRVVEESLSVYNYQERWKRGVVEIVVRLQPGARPGRKTLTVNGGRRTFDIAFTNYREPPKVVELRFIQKDGTAIVDPVRYGEDFYLEARFSAAPPEAQHVVKLDWNGGTRDVAVFKQKDTTIFRSAPLSLGAPPAASQTRSPRESR